MTAGALLVVFGADTGDKQPHAFIPQSTLGDRKPDQQDEGGRKSTIIFRGEQALMEKIQMLSEKGIKPKVYFTQFNDELEIDDQTVGRQRGDFRGGESLRSLLRKDNYDVRGLVWGVQPKQFKDNELYTHSKKDAKSVDEVPQDASLVVIVYPFLLFEIPPPYPKNGLEALERYLSRGGKLMVINPTPIQADAKVFDSGLPELLKKYGVQCSMDFILNFKEKGNYKKNIEFRGPWYVIGTAPANTTNLVAREFASQQVELTAPHSIRPLPSSNFKAEVMLEVKQPPNEIFWAETDPVALLNPIGFFGILGRDKIESRRSTEPIPVAVGVIDQKSPQKPRLVVLGDSWNAGNRYVTTSGAYYDFIRSSMEWLVERPVPVIGIAPKVSGEFRLKSHRGQARSDGSGCRWA